MLRALRKNDCCWVDAQHGQHCFVGNAVDWQGGVGLESGDESNGAFAEYAVNSDALLLWQFEICIEGSLQSLDVVLLGRPWPSAHQAAVRLRLRS